MRRKESAAVRRRRRGFRGCCCSRGVIIGGTVSVGLLTEAPGAVAGTEGCGVARRVLSCAASVVQKSAKKNKKAVICRPIFPKSSIILYLSFARFHNSGAKVVLMCKC